MPLRLCEASTFEGATYSASSSSESCTTFSLISRDFTCRVIRADALIVLYVYDAWSRALDAMELYVACQFWLCNQRLDCYELRRETTLFINPIAIQSKYISGHRFVVCRVVLGICSAVTQD